MKKRNVILRGVVSAAAAVALLIFVGLVLAGDLIEVKMTPQHVSLTNSYVRFLRCNVNSEYWVGSRGGSLSVDGADAILPVKVESHIVEHDTTVVFFFIEDVRVDYRDVRDMLSEAGATGEVEFTLTITRDDGDLVGSDTIMVVE